MLLEHDLQVVFPWLKDSVVSSAADSSSGLLEKFRTYTSVRLFSTVPYRPI
jgi:hypothetical protein